MHRLLVNLVLRRTGRSEPFGSEPPPALLFVDIPQKDYPHLRSHGHISSHIGRNGDAVPPRHAAFKL